MQGRTLLFSQQVVAALKAKTESERLQKVGALFAATGDILLRGAGTEQVCQSSRASMPLQDYAAGDVRVTQCFLTLFREKNLSPFFLNGSSLLPSVITKEKAPTETCLFQSVPGATEALHHFHIIG